MHVEMGSVIAKSESGSGGVDIYTVIYDERIKCEQARKFRAEREMRALYTANQLRRRDQDTMT